MSAAAGAWDLAAAPAWRPRARRGRRRPWHRWLPWGLAAALHAAALGALLLNLDPETLREPRILEGTPLVWEGAVGAGEGARTLAPEAPAAPDPPAPEEAPTPPVPPAPPAGAAPPSPTPPVPEEAPEPAAPAAAAPPPAPAGPAPAPAAPPVPSPSSPAPRAPQPAPRPVSPPRAPAEELPLPLPAAPPAPPRAAPPAAAPPAAPMRAVEVPLPGGALRLGAGSAGTPGESRTVGAPQPGCQDAIGYPPAERAQGITGAVGFRLRVSDDGRVVEARMVESSGSPGLDEAARRGLRRCRFVPATRDGIPVWGSRDYRVVFRVD